MLPLSLRATDREGDPVIAVLIWIALGLGALVALLLLALALLLLVPVELDGIWTDDTRRFAVAGPGLRLGYDVAERSLEIRVLSLRVGRFTPRDGERSPRRRRRTSRERRKRGRRRISPTSLWRDRRQIGAALRAFVRRVRIERFRARAVIASPDPAWTGWATGMAYAGWGALPARVRHGAEVRVDFEGEVPRLEGEAALRFRPVIVALLALRMWWVVRRARRRPASTRSRVRPASEAGGRNEAS
jgi:hypothetical protein